DKVEKEKAEYKKNTEEFYQLNQEIQFHEQSKKDTPIVIGDAVKLILNGMIGKVVDIEKDKITVITEHMTFKLKLKEIIKLKSVIDIQKAQAITTNTIRTNEPFNATLDMRGMKIQEAQLSLESFIDKALLANVNAVNILHGKGSGILKETVARTLRGQNYVKKLFHPSSDQGGDGITIVELR
ncbi:MAG TPA: Smr/MutS family protein, partial [Saprospiraceae bacterium]|nr:Smr/MutS family protein [Saprospiraceae bacterium]